MSSYKRYMSRKHAAGRAQVGIWECLAELARTSVREPTGVWAGSGVHASPSGQGLDFVEC